MYRLKSTLLICIWSLCMSFSPAASAAFISPDNENIQYFGRWEITAETAKCGYGATYIKANFWGTSIGVHLTNQNCWWCYSVDEGPFVRIKPKTELTTLMTGLAFGKHSIQLVRATEGEAGITEFKGFELDKNCILLEPSPKKTLKLEFVGDSICAGAFNNETESVDFFDREDNNMAFPPQLSRMLDADYSVLAKSGEGVSRNYDEATDFTGVHTADRYAWSFCSSSFQDSHSEWSFKEPADAIVLAIGTNDFSLHLPPPDKTTFITSYIQLINTVRSKNKDSAIICTEPVPSCIGTTPGKWIKEAVTTVTKSGDTNVFYISLNEPKPLLSDSDYVGDQTHPTKAGATKIALYLKGKLQAVLAKK